MMSDWIAKPCAAIALCILLIQPALAAPIYRCEVGGQKVFQQTPCPETASVEQRLDTDAGFQSRTQHTQAMEGNTGIDPASQWLEERERERRQTQLQRKIRDIEQRMASAKARLNAELSRLEIQRSHAENNQAGATYLHSLAEEKRAAVDKYEADAAGYRQQIDALREQMAALHAP